MDPIAFPVFMVLVVFGLPIGAWVVRMTFAHRERMAMIQQGLDPRAFRRGSAAPSGPRPVSGFEVPQGSDGSAERNLHRGIRLTAIGVALFIGLSFIGYDHAGGPFNAPMIQPGPWLLGGLIPMFVGIAQIIVALLSGAQFGRPGRGWGNDFRGGSYGGGAPNPTKPYPGRSVPGDAIDRPSTPPAQR